MAGSGVGLHTSRTCPASAMTCDYLPCLTVEHAFFVLRLVHTCKRPNDGLCRLVRAMAHRDLPFMLRHSA